MAVEVPLCHCRCTVDNACFESGSLTGLSRMKAAETEVWLLIRRDAKVRIFSYSKILPMLSSRGFG
jgi:hypothetical protein